MKQGCLVLYKAFLLENTLALYEQNTTNQIVVVTLNRFKAMIFQTMGIS